jgi:hypothetical protein
MLPAKKLTDKQIALVDIMVAEGLPPAKAASKAGYSEGKAGYVSAYRALKTAHVQQYLMQRMNEEFGVSATAAMNTVRRLSQNAKSEYVQLEASKDLLDRAGYKPIDRAQVQVATFAFQLILARGWGEKPPTRYGYWSPTSIFFSQGFVHCQNYFFYSIGSLWLDLRNRLRRHHLGMICLGLSYY